jgi:hypothetical protein
MWVKVFQIVVDVYIVEMLVSTGNRCTSHDNNDLAESDGTGMVFAYL